MFWKIMKPMGGGDPSGPIADTITKTFGNFKDFQTKFNAAGAGQFGSGWVWLAGKSAGEVHIMSTPNQDNPISQGLYPIFGNDVWEHAYYLKYNNRRPEYLAAWWNVRQLGRNQQTLRHLQIRQIRPRTRTSPPLSLVSCGADTPVRRF